MTVNTSNAAGFLGYKEDDELKELLVCKILESYPWLHRGDDMTAPVNLIDETGCIPPVRDFFEVDCVVAKPVTAFCFSFKLPLDDLELRSYDRHALEDPPIDEKLFKDAKFIHVYQCAVSTFADRYNVGDTLTAIDPATWTQVEVPVTAEMIEKEAKGYIRFGLS